MFPEKFEYVRAASVEEALQIVEANEGAKLLAGGHSLLPAMKLRLTDVPLLVDISRIASLKGVTANGSLTIGALTTHAEIAGSADVQHYCVALAQATGQVGDRQVRNFGTLGGNIAHADPASDPPTVLVACDATIHVQGKGGKRAIKAGDFFLDLFTTALAEGEIITAIEVPNHSAHKCAYAKLEHPASRYAVVGVAVCLALNGATCTSASIAVGGATNRATRCPNAEAALAGKPLDDAALNAAAAAIASDIDDDSIMDDISYPAAYRRAMLGVYLKRAIKAALG